MPNTPTTPPAAATATATIKGSPARGLAAAAFGFFFGTSALSLLGPSIKNLNMDLTPVAAALLVAIPTLSGSLLRIPFGASVDANGGRKPFLLLMGLSVVGLIGLSILLTARYPDKLDGTYGYFLLFGCLSGCGVATFSVGAGQSSYWYPKSKSGFVIGVFAGFGTLGAGVFAILLPQFIKAVGFTGAYYILAACILIATAIYFLIGCNAWYFQYREKGLDAEESRRMALARGQELFPAGNTKQSLLLSAKTPETWILVIAYFVTFGGFLALVVWLPTYWQKAHDFSSAKAGLYTGVYGCLAALLRIPGGRLADKLGGLKVSMFSIILLGVATVVMAFSSHWMLSGICTLAIALAFGFGNASIMKLVPVYISKSVGGASGWVGGLGAFGGFVIPLVMGKIAGDMGLAGYARGFLTFTVLSVIVLLTLYFGLVVRKRNK